MRIERLSTAEEMATAARSRLYLLLVQGFGYPERAFFAALAGGAFLGEVEEACRPLPYPLEPSPERLTADGDYVQFQADYLRIFEVGAGSPPCPLYSGLYRGGRKAVMEELTRFYNYFGLSLERGGGELPDHLTTELEFMHFLTFKEVFALSRGLDPASYRRAQADFLERQLLSWLPALEARLGRLEPPPLYAKLSRLATAFTQADLTYLRSVVERVDLPVLGGG